VSTVLNTVFRTERHVTFDTCTADSTTHRSAGKSSEMCNVHGTGSGPDSGCWLSFPVRNVAADMPPKSVGARPYFIILAQLPRDVQLNADPAGTRVLPHRD